MPDATEAQAREAIAASLAAGLERDAERGVTHHGPHRDDVDLRVDGVSLRRYGSAGQQRTAAIALRMLECAWHRERGGGEPLLLLDDPVAELDRGRAARVLSLLTSTAGQVFLAVPREDDIPAALTTLRACGSGPVPYHPSMPNKKAEPLAATLRRYLNQQGLAKRVGQQSALEAWPRVVGPAVAAAGAADFGHRRRHAAGRRPLLRVDERTVTDGARSARGAQPREPLRTAVPDPVANRPAKTLAIKKLGIGRRG